MIELAGKYTSAKVFTDVVDSSAIGQVIALLNQPYAEGSRIRMMPDIHAGAGCTIGTTMTIRDKICPNLVGVDIGCFTGDTLIPLSDGKPDTCIKDLEGQDVWIYAMNDQHQIIPAPAKCVKTRVNAPLVDVALDNGEHIRCTPDHKFMCHDFSYKAAEELLPGQRLRPFVTSYDQDGYLFVNQPYGVNMKHYPFHRFIKHYIEGEDIDGLVVHHRNANKLDNRPENLQIKTFADHSSHHMRSQEVMLFRRESFKKHRKAILDAKGYYDPAIKGKKQQVARDNITTYMREHPDHFAQVVAENAKRFSQLARSTNSSFYEQSRRQLRKLQIIVKTFDDVGEITEESWNDHRHIMYNGATYKIAKQRLDQFNMTFADLLDESCWKAKMTANHKVVSVTHLDYTEDVYCLQVPEHHNFALTSGVFVHNCGMETVRIREKHIEMEQLDKLIRNEIPSGFNIRKTPHRYADNIDFEDLYCAKHADLDRARLSVSTLGGGNHFAEVDKDDEGNLYIVIHSGSRHLGTEIANYYQEAGFKALTTLSKEETDKIIADLKAAGRQKDIQKALKSVKRACPVPKPLAYVEGDLLEQYLHDMVTAQEFARWNRKAMMDVIVKGLKLHVEEEFTTIHNYIDVDNGILRKGAVSAQKGEKLLIPINMRDGSLICIGKGNPDWNFSAPHGAGRLMSRSAARESFTVSEFKKTMEGIYSTSIGRGTLDESPMAYKGMDDIVNNIGHTADIVKIIKPIYNFKAGAEET